MAEDIQTDDVFKNEPGSPKVDADKEKEPFVSTTSKPGGLKPNEQNVVIALDGSDMSIQAVNWYLERVHRSGNRLVFVHVIELPEPKLNEARSLHMSPGVLASMWKDEEARVKELEKKMKAILKEKGIKGVLRTATGKPGEIICRIAEEENSAMIIVGTRGMGRIRKTILGSVSDFLVNHAHCPVIVCKTRTRKQSAPGGASRRGSEGRLRHFSGESIKRLFSIGRQTSRSQSVDCDTEMEVKENGESAATGTAISNKLSEEKENEVN